MVFYNARERERLRVSNNELGNHFYVGKEKVKNV